LGLFNAGLEGLASIHEGDRIDAKALQAPFVPPWP
jgi:hypothetical protein